MPNCLASDQRILIDVFFSKGYLVENHQIVKRSDADQARHILCLDVGPNCSQKKSAGNKGKYLNKTCAINIL